MRKLIAAVALMLALAVGGLFIFVLTHETIPAGYVGYVYDRNASGDNVIEGIQSAGVIDAGYTGSIRVKLYNHGSGMVHIKKGQKISQLVLLPIITPELEVVDSLEETERGNGGFGSSGAF